MIPVMEAVGLAKSFAGKRDLRGRVVEWNHAVKDVSLHVDAGETVAVVGESGAGKSTVGRMLLRLIDPDRGSLRLQGTDLMALDRKALRAIRQKMQMIFQNPYASLDPRMVIGDAVGEAVTLHRGLKSDERQDVVRDLLARVGLHDYQLERYPYEFSGGQLQRVAIARALATEPDLIVCDEPVAALDVSIRAQVINLLRDLQSERGLAYVFISHDLALVRLIAHRVVVMYKGRVVESGEAEMLFAEPKHPYTRALMSVVPVPDPRKRPTESRVVPRATSEEAGSAGCEYAPRCPMVMEQCWSVVPELDQCGNGTRVACHLYTEARPVPESSRQLGAAGA